MTNAALTGLNSARNPIFPTKTYLLPLIVADQGEWEKQREKTETASENTGGEEKRAA